MDLLDKVRLIIGNKCESPSQFADEIDIPRSAVSHLLSGRNKPSLDVIGKIIRRYPEIGKDWIWDDDKLPILDKDVSGWDSSEIQSKKTQEPVSGKPLDLFAQLPPAQEVVQKNVGPIKSDKSQRKVERVLLFFSDGTFEEFSAL